MLKFDDRFARQDRCEPPPEFPLASPCSSIVHHLSGLSTHALAPRPLATSMPRAGVAPAPQGAGSRPFCLSCATGVLGAHRLARVLNSLVRVSRRVRQSARNHTTRTLCATPRRPALQTHGAATVCGCSPPPAYASPPARAAPLGGAECTAGAPRPHSQPTPRRPVTPNARRLATLPPGF